jgi:Alpha/beta hydrolase family
MPLQMFGAVLNIVQLTVGLHVFMSSLPRSPSLLVTADRLRVLVSAAIVCLNAGSVRMGGKKSITARSVAVRNLVFQRSSIMVGPLSLCMTLAACDAPIAVERADARSVQTELTSNALTTGRLSGSTMVVLQRLDLLGVYATNPTAALRALNLIMTADTRNPDLLFALAEMAFLEGEKTKDQAYFLVTAVYSYAFLFPASPPDRPNPFDPRLRVAADLYNRGLTRGLASADGTHVDLRAGDYPLPSGTLSIAFDPAALHWAGFELTGFVPAAELRIEGLNNRFRETGIGVPLAADLKPVGDERGFQVARSLKVPATALLRLNISAATIASGRFTGRLMLYPGDEEREVEINGQRVPLENEPSAAFAYALSNPAIWKTEIAGFFRGDLFENLPTQLVALSPYRPGRIPVVLIHGTASSAGRWADLVNDLQNDPAIRDRFQFWLFTYNTGNPVPLSALRLRTDLEAAVNKLDPDRRDLALRNMVLVGHSQGGLLAKMQVVDSGSRLFGAFSSKPLDGLHLTSETKETIRRALFVMRMPDVTRVIFIATPHRGSFAASGSLAQWVGRLVTLPLSVTRMAMEVLVSNSDALRLDPKNARIGSMYGMTPGSPFSTTLASIPVAPSVAAHSIIAVKGEGPVQNGGDGVVQYNSAHIDEAASELVVRSGHSVQSNPKTIAEVRRILLLHWQTVCPKGCSPTGMMTGSRMQHPQNPDRAFDAGSALGADR